MTLGKVLAVAPSWQPGRTLLTADAFFLVGIDAAGARVVLATEASLPGRDHRNTLH